jgi:hypothetical protein
MGRLRALAQRLPRIAVSRECRRLPTTPHHSHWIHTMLRCALSIVLTASIVMPAAAQVQRNFPANALRGVVQFGNPPELLLNGKPARLAPGARIRGENNMLQMSGSLVGAKAVVNYTIERQSGLLLDVWVLTADEARVKPWPVNEDQAASWSFDPVAQTWTRR